MSEEHDSNISGLYQQSSQETPPAHIDRAVLSIKTKLAELGFKCEVQKIGIDNANVYHRVRVGPFTDYVALDKSRKKLRELGFETQVIKQRE